MRFGFVGLILAVLCSVASAAAIVNGGFEVDGGAFGSCPETTPTVWTGGSLCSAGFYGATPPEGSHFAIIGGGGDFPSLSLSQAITGLTISNSYTVTFYLGGENWHSSTTEQVQVSMLSGSSTGSQTYSAPHSTCNGCFGSSGLWTNWTAFTYSFLATGTSAQIRFMNVSSSADDTGIDNVSIAAASTGVPEPRTLALLGAGLGSLALFRRRRR